jgi:hypothetical protein
MIGVLLSFVLLGADAPMCVAPSSNQAEEANGAPEAPADIIQPPANKGAYDAKLAMIRSAPVKSLFDFAEYEGTIAANEDLGDGARIGGASVRMAGLFVPQPLDTVRDFYLRALAKRGLGAIPSSLNNDVATLAFRDPADGFMRSLTLVRQQGGTAVLAAVGDPARILDSHARSLPADWPMPPVVGEPVDMEFTDGPMVQRTRHASLSVPAKQVIEFYKRELPAKGWNEQPGPRDGKLMAGFVKGSERCSITAIPHSTSTSALEVVCLGRRSP